MMIGSSKFSNTTFQINIHFEYSIDFEGYYLNNISFNYYIGIVQFQYNDMANKIYEFLWFPNNINNKTMISSTLFGIYSINCDLGSKARIKMINFIISQNNIINFVNDLIILDFCERHLSKVMIIFHDYFNIVGIHNNVLNSPSNEYVLYVTCELNITDTILILVLKYAISYVQVNYKLN